MLVLRQKTLDFLQEEKYNKPIDNTELFKEEGL